MKEKAVRKTLISHAVLALTAGAAMARCPSSKDLNPVSIKPLSDPSHPDYIPPIMTKEMLAAQGDRRPIHQSAGSAQGSTKPDKRPRIIGNDEKFIGGGQHTARSPAPA